MITEKRIEDALSQHPSIQATELLIQEELGTNNVRPGGRVAVVADPTYPYDGLVGTVRGPIPQENSGTVKVAFANGNVVDLMVNQLVPVQA